MLPRLLECLGHESARYREGAIHGLAACGPDIVLQHLSRIVPLLQDPQDFVRIAAVEVIAKVTDDAESQLAMLKATVVAPVAVAPNSVRNATQGVLFGKDHALARTPFEAGFDEALVRQALEDVLLTDPGGAKFLASRKAIWSQDTVRRIAGPLTFIA
ncbi:MAG: HEAT repeat domain-containing protein, partial [Verrucomicrobiae bacterium]|nr:HEAT repeat domain-containing protein [Verrucomicrobiae bacterium]